MAGEFPAHPATAARRCRPARRGADRPDLAFRRLVSYPPKSDREVPMGARTGKQYLAGLREQEREVWLGGERVRDVTTHPGLKNGARAIASLYDMQHDPKLRDAMTYVSPTSGERVGLSFLIPRTREDLETRRVMMLNWARTTCGMMGRSPDFMNVTYSAWAGAAEFFAQGKPEYGDNMRRYYEYIRENDLTLTHSLINLQRSRTVSGVFNLQEGTALAGGARDRCRDRRARRADSRDPGAARRRDRGLFAAHGPAHREPQPVRAELRHPMRDQGAQIPVPRQLRPWPLAFRPPARARVSRRWIARSFSTMCWCRGSGCFCWATSTGSTPPRPRPTPRRIRRIRARPRTSPNASSCWARRC